MSKSSERYVADKHYKEGRAGKPFHEPRGFIDKLFDAKQADKENRIASRSWKNGRTDRDQKR